LDDAIRAELARLVRVEVEIATGQRKRRPPMDPEVRREAGDRLLRGRKVGYSRGRLRPETFERVHGRPPKPSDWAPGESPHEHH
jgi:hypothetical protein